MDELTLLKEALELQRQTVELLKQTLDLLRSQMLVNITVQPQPYIAPYPLPNTTPWTPNPYQPTIICGGTNSVKSPKWENTTVYYANS